ncbi:DUF7555 family protein [Haloarcula sp. NS06]|uniref:DUF7555 family protein n=1 Tax=unclassified Haloarcula TaxID=2624677 RepID=UPI0027ADB52D|nr:hypothetical protein [Haloarcula sp. H-GB4]MDQ2071192.1 hypothetical protein [Haloarcula sp. H-GB4]
MDNLAGKVLDLLWYALGVTLTAMLIGGVLSPLRGGGWVTVKFALFFIGFALFGYASVTLWRAPSLGSDESGESNVSFGVSARDRTPFESLLARVVPPLDTLAPPEDRLSPPVKLFVASLFVLGLSLSMEVVFGVQ